MPQPEQKLHIIITHGLSVPTHVSQPTYSSTLSIHLLHLYESADEHHSSPHKLCAKQSRATAASAVLTTFQQAKGHTACECLKAGRHDNHGCCTNIAAWPI